MNDRAFLPPLSMHLHWVLTLLDKLLLLLLLGLLKNALPSTMGHVAICERRLATVWCRLLGGVKYIEARTRHVYAFRLRTDNNELWLLMLSRQRIALVGLRRFLRSLHLQLV